MQFRCVASIIVWKKGNSEEKKDVILLLHSFYLEMAIFLFVCERIYVGIRTNLLILA